MEIILYSTNCPKCKILEKKLTEKNKVTIKNKDNEIIKLKNQNRKYYTLLVDNGLIKK